MSKKPPPPDKRFKPGQSGNPGGRPKLPDDVREARKLNQVELERVVNKYLYMTKEAVKESIQAEGTPMMELMVASIMAQAAQKGDQQRLEFILQRLIGRVKDQIEITLPKPFVVTRLDGSQTVMGAALPPKDEEQ